MDALRAEAPGILAWLVEGAVRYAKQGLEPPAEVVRLTRSYLAEMDPMSRWLESYDRCEPKRGTLAADLFREFQVWHRDEDTGQGVGPDNATAFGKALGARGIPKQGSVSGNRYGLAPKPAF